MFHEHKSAVVVVVRKGTEGLRPNRHLGVEFVSSVKVWPLGNGPSVNSGSVDAAHAVDGDLLDQQFFGHHVTSSGLLGGVFVALFHVGQRSHYLRFGCKLRNS